MHVTVHEQLTLDGIAQANGGNDERTDPGFTRGGWALPLGDDDGVAYILDAWRMPHAFLLGRRTYELFAEYWGPRADDGGFGQAIGSKPRFVASETVTGAEWPGTTVLSGDVGRAVRELRERPGGELLVVGSVALARWLLREGLVDRLDLVQFPVLVGEGDPFFPIPGPDHALELESHRVFDTGVVARTFRVGGRPQYA